MKEQCVMCGEYFDDLQNHECDIPELNDMGNAGGEESNEYADEEYITDVVIKDEQVTGKKWFMFAVGGAGTHILDSIIIRTKYVESNKNDMLDKVWDAAIENYVLYDTNITGIAGSFIASDEVKNWDRPTVVSMCQLGASGDDVDEGDEDARTGGAGGSIIAGEKAMKHTIETGDFERFRFIGNKVNQIRTVQAIMYIHSTISGTGCGATPVLARYIRENIGRNKLSFSLTVLPSTGNARLGSGEKACVGLARIVKSVDAVLLVDNNALEKKGNANIGEVALIDKQPTYYKKNGNIVELLELFSTSSSINNVISGGDMFDVRDAITPPRDQMNKKNGVMHAPILVPVIGSIKTTSIPKDNVKDFIFNLFVNTIIGGKLAQCDHKNAKGASFIIYGPGEYMHELNKLMDDGTIEEFARSARFLNDPQKQKTIKFYFSVIKNAPEITMWGFLWNPPIELMDMMVGLVHKFIEDKPNNDLSNILRDALPTIKEVHDVLGKCEY